MYLDMGIVSCCIEGQETCRPGGSTANAPLQCTALGGDHNKDHSPVQVVDLYRGCYCSSQKLSYRFGVRNHNFSYRFLGTDHAWSPFSRTLLVGDRLYYYHAYSSEVSIPVKSIIPFGRDFRNICDVHCFPKATCILPFLMEKNVAYINQSLLFT